MEFLKKNIFLILLIVFIFILFLPWFISGAIIGGDFWIIYPKNLLDRHIYPYSWYWDRNNGLGGLSSPLLWAYLSSSTPMVLLGKVFHFSIENITKFGFFYPYLVLVVSSSMYFYKKLFKNNFLSILASLVYTTNTYILMLVGGGQILLGIAYALGPILLAIMMDIESNKKNIFQKIILLSILFAVEMLLDLRIAYVIFFAIFSYAFFTSLLNLRVISRKVIYILFGSFALSFLLQSFWILPSILHHQNLFDQLGSVYTTTNAVQYFSFAKFEDAMGLLHPNWPENIFGKVYFMRPEFLLLPILAFGALLFIKPLEKFKQENKTIIFFALLGLIGIFLAKGANDPFGGIYLWMFGHIPGFVMFRDPTKWYVLIAISYAILIPFTIGKIYEWIKTRNKFLIFNFQFLINSKIINLQNAFLVLVIGYLLFLIRPALLGQLGGTFKTHTVPQEYVALEKYLSSQNTFSRIMWVPSLERYGFNSATHPAVGVEDFYHATSVSAALSDLNKHGEEKHLQDLSIKYIIVPYDAEGELFVKDRKYDNAQYLQTIAALQKLPWLREIPGFGKIHVFVLSNAKDHFWLVNKQKAELTYQLIDPTTYKLDIKNTQKGDRIVFTDTYDNHWQLSVNNKEITSLPFGNTLNSFVLPQSGSYTTTLYYTPQRWVNIGLIISGITFVVIVITLLSLFRKNSERRDMIK